MGKTKILAIAPLLLAMYGCSSDSSAPVNNDTAVSGLFLDAEVEGLTYTTDSGITGKTDANGTYKYLPGEKVSFSIGGVDIGTVNGAPKCTPFDFGVASTNIARFIQSLDADGDPTNGIDIVAASTVLAGIIISSDAFTVDTATFEANAAITGALATTGDTLIDEATALSNLNTGTDNTFENTELEGKLFAVIDPTNNDIGIISFDTIANGAEVFSVFAGETKDAGGDGLGADEIWSVGTDGVLTLTDPVGGSVTKVNRAGASTSSISVTYSENGTTPLPATFLIPKAFTASDLGAAALTAAGATYDVIDSDGASIKITFFSNGTFYDTTNDESGTFEDDGTPGVIAIVNTSYPGEITIMVVLDGNPNVIDETASIMLLGADIISPDVWEFTNIGIGSITLKSIASATPPV